MGLSEIRYLKPTRQNLPFHLRTHAISLFVGTERTLKRTRKKEQEQEIEMFVIVRNPLFSITNENLFLHFPTVLEFSRSF